MSLPGAKECGVCHEFKKSTIQRMDGEMRCSSCESNHTVSLISQRPCKNPLPMSLRQFKNPAATPHPDSGFKA